MVDKTTKLLLALIAVGLFANAVVLVLHASGVKAADAMTCDGKLATSPFGINYPGGFSINFDCK
jgi:hypothetical protein